MLLNIGDNIKPFQNKFRPDLVDHIVNDLEKGETSSLVCLSGIGKTNTVHWVKKQLQENDQIITIHIDLENMLSNEILSFYRLALIEIYESITNKVNDKSLKKLISGTYKNYINKPDHISIFRGIKDIVSKIISDTSLNICIIFDAYENFDKTKSPILQSLNVLRKIDKYRVIFFIVSSKDLNTIVDKNTGIDLLLTYNKHWLTFLNKNETFALIEEFTGLAKAKLSKSKKLKIWRLSGGHAWLIKSLTKLFTEDKIAESTDLEELLNLESIKSRFDHIWSTLLKPIKEFIIKAVDSKRELKNIPEFIKYTEIIKFKDGKYNFFSPLLEYYIREYINYNEIKYLNKQNIEDRKKVNSSNPEKRQSRISLDRKRMTFIKYGKPIDSFTKSEFKLLEYFYKHSSEVISRDDIAKIIWGDKSTKKYSDWAIDKLISRLRDKIEEDSSKPQILKTIRGVGYKFIIK